MFKVILFVGVALVSFAVPLSASIIHVPGDSATIQSAINGTSNGDTVLVQPYTYVENIDFDGHNIVVGSLFLMTEDDSYISSTIIDGGNAGPVVTFENGENSSAVIMGFTIQNGSAINGSGIFCSYSNPTISHNTITGNSTSSNGGGIFCSYSNPTINNNTISGNSTRDGGGIYCTDCTNPIISNNTISGNSVVQEGGGILCLNSNPIISHNTISGNSAVDEGGGGILCVNSNPPISHNTIIGNSASSGGGIYCVNSNPPISNNTISGNSAGSGGGIFCNYCDALIVNTIFWANSASNGNEIYIEVGESPVFSYCDIQGGWQGDGNIDVDPLFRDPDNDNFHLQSITNPDCGGPGDSPCIDAGAPNILDNFLNCDWGLGEYRSDIGAYGGAVPFEDIPTLSEWGMIILALLLLAAGTVAVVRRHRAVYSEEAY